jgi:hypothetical protein
MFVCCDHCMLSGTGLCEGAEPSSREFLPSNTMYKIMCVFTYTYSQNTTMSDSVTM